MDQLAAAKPFVKAAYRVHRAEDIGRGLARAIRTAISGRPGGVYLDIPAAVLGEVLDAEKGAASLWRLVDRRHANCRSRRPWTGRSNSSPAPRGPCWSSGRAPRTPRRTT